MNYYAHTSSLKDNQLLSEHLTNTAQRSRDFCTVGLKNCAYLAGLMHDIGKYQPSFQKRLAGAPIRVDHSVCGAKEACAFFPPDLVNRLFAYTIAGHHAGLPDHGSSFDQSDSSVLTARLSEESEDYSAYKREITLPDMKPIMRELDAFAKGVSGAREFADCYEFMVRYLFSCLTDADFLDTEAYCTGSERTSEQADWKSALSSLRGTLTSFCNTTQLQKARTLLQAQAKENILSDASVYLLNMPTGSGKTLCSLLLALMRLLKTGKKRIIYVIPYTSIVEQTANEFRRILPDVPILEHHSNFDFDEQDGGGEDADAILRYRQSTENWDAPFIITTNVQFFESIYSNRSSRLRKLHNMADSVIVFDEMHTLPIAYFIPCMKAIGELTERYNSEALFLTATMPDYRRMVEKYMGGNRIRFVDLLPDRSLFSVFEKNSYVDLGDRCVLECISRDRSNLVVCNSKALAENYYDSFKGDKYYLSTNLTPNDRSRRIAEIKQRLANRDCITVFSTSLIEAGVDFDFDAVYREISGVDNILQTGGRCNREGKRKREDSTVYIFRSDHRMVGDIAVKANITEGLIRKYGTDSIQSEPCVREYFNELYRSKEFTMFDTRDKQTPKQQDIFKINFRSIAERFRFIESTTAAVVIPNLSNAEEIGKLKAVGVCNYRKLTRDCASVTCYHLKELMQLGAVAKYGRMFVLENPDYYSEDKGLQGNVASDYIF